MHNIRKELSIREKSSRIQKMFDTVAGRYDFLNGILSFSLDTTWRRKAVKLSDIQDNQKVLDLACGTGDMIEEIQKQHPKAQVIGGDFSLNMLYCCKKKLPDSILLAADACNLPFKDNSFDRLTISFGFRNIVDREQGLLEFLRVLKSGGKACILELTIPENKFIGFFYKIYFKHILPIIGGIFSSKKAYRYLPDSVYDFPKIKECKSLMESAGFKNIQFHKILFGIAIIAIMEK